MNMFGSLRLLACASGALLVAACSASVQPPDYTAFRDAKPRSILVLSPVNHTPDVKATSGVLAQMTRPLAEGGYYVVPVAVAAETFRQNGLDTPDDIAQVPAAKLRSIFGVDAVLYTTVTKYGSVYQVINSDTTVKASAKLVDLRTGSVLWNGAGEASSQEGGAGSHSSSGIVGLLVQAAVTQVVHNLTDQSFDIAGVASERMLHAGPPTGLLYGPRSPKYGTD
jgi:hypothetical protein